MGQGCDTATGIFGSIFAVIGICVLIFGYSTNLNYNNSFVQGVCRLSQGVVLEGKCQVSQPGCWSCTQTCWNAFYGLSAVPGVSKYFFLKTYFDEQSAYNALGYKIGFAVSPCYYRYGGTSIIFELADVFGTLIAGIFFTCAATIILTLGGLVYCYENKSCKGCSKNIGSMGAGSLDARNSGANKDDRIGTTTNQPRLTDYPKIDSDETDRLIPNIQHSINTNFKDDIV